MKDKLTLATALGLGLMSGAAMAQDYPNRAVSIIVPAGAGGGGDFTSRIIAEAMSKDFPAGLIVENKPGAAGVVGAKYAKDAAADGYTLLSSNQSISSLSPQLDPSLPINPVKDFVAICVTSTYPTGIQVAGDAPYNSVSEMIAAAKAEGRPYTFAQVSAFMDLTAKVFAKEAGIPAKAVAYKSMPEAVTDVASGRVDFFIGDLNSGKAFMETGKLKALAITSSERNPIWPDLPSAEEAGLKDFDLFAWTAIVAPKDIDPAIRAKIADSLGRALATDAVKQKYAASGFTASSLCGDEAQAFVENDHAEWAQYIAHFK